MAANFDQFLQAPVCNGHREEQALIRRWWYEAQGGRGRLVWEYCLSGSYADAVWFPEGKGPEECPGRRSNALYPIKGQRIHLFEAKLRLVPEVIGQALVYRELARAAGAVVESTVVFAKRGEPHMVQAAESLGLKVVLGHAV